jgi:hypothetical protein
MAASSTTKPLRKADFITLGPGQQFSFSRILHGTDLYDKFNKGQYVIRVKYKNTSGDEFKLNAWKGEIYSNEVIFEIN